MVHSRQIEVDLPCGTFYDLSHLVMDLNGTITVDGKLVEGVYERLEKIAEILNIHIITADTNQTVDDIQNQLSKISDIKFYSLKSGRGDLQKLEYVEALGREHTAAIGNGCNDALMLKEASLGICIMGVEGASIDALLASNVVFHDICDALDIFLKPHRMIATLRK